MIISFKWSQNLCERSLYSKYSFSHITHIIQCKKVTLGIHIDMRWIYIPRKVQGQRFSFKVTGKDATKCLHFFLEKWFFRQSPSLLSNGINLWWCEYEISIFQLFSIHWQCQRWIDRVTTFLQLCILYPYRNIIHVNCLFVRNDQQNS